LLSSERCPNCKELNDKTRETCYKCGFRLSEKKRLEDAERERKAKAQERETLKAEMMDEIKAEMMDELKQELLEALAKNELKKKQDDLTDEQIDELSELENQEEVKAYAVKAYESIPKGLYGSLKGLEMTPEEREEIPENEEDIIKRILNKK
jgi:hypothetical protein